VSERPLIIRAEGRPYPGETVSGDGWAVDWDDQACRVAVIDGLGHGPEAARAKDAAIAVLSANPTLRPDEALRRCHLALRGTRGAAISIARIEPLVQRLVYAGVGNVEARLWRDGEQVRPVALRGIVGAALPTIRTFEYSLSDEWTLLLHTDGISARFAGPDVLAAVQNEPLEVVPLLLRDWSRPLDDATALVIRPRPI
jgi:serine phosphatase RsbU (regulator of sigma subunit)